MTPQQLIDRVELWRRAQAGEGTLQFRALAGGDWHDCHNPDTTVPDATVELRLAPVPAPAPLPCPNCGGHCTHDTMTAGLWPCPHCASLLDRGDREHARADAATVARDEWYRTAEAEYRGRIQAEARVAELQEKPCPDGAIARAAELEARCRKAVEIVRHWGGNIPPGIATQLVNALEARA